MRLSELIAPDLLSPAARGIDIAGITADSRKVGPGYLFAAIPGTRQDGRAFIADAVRRGAVAVLAPPGGGPQAGGDGDGSIGARAADICVIADPDPRGRLARIAARFYGARPRIIAAVTGTNGKTSTVEFSRQLWRGLGRRGASLGTLGLVTDDGCRGNGLTTPDPVDLHARLKALAEAGIDHLAIEASSHGLDQHRLDGLAPEVAVFTNLSRDHLDYHRTMAAYLAAKVRLFRRVMRCGGQVVVNADVPETPAIAAGAGARAGRILSYGRAAGADLCLANRLPRPDGQDLDLILFGRARRVRLPLVGEFQALNALAALALVIAGGEAPDAALAQLPHLAGVRGRLELAARLAGGAAVYVDYAHTPGALQTVLTALRPHTRARLWVVFGCGGDRDPGKRIEMGRAAAAFADRVILTDDNPRSEDPAAIRRQARAGCPQAEEIAGREAAIRAAIAGLGAGDVLVIAGKGHEQGQIVGDHVYPFDDVRVARRAAGAGLEAGG